MSNADISNQAPAAASKRKAVLGRESLNMPNLVTGTRLLLSLLLFSMIASGGWWISAAALFVFSVAFPQPASAKIPKEAIASKKNIFLIIALRIHIQFNSSEGHFKIH